VKTFQDPTKFHLKIAGDIWKCGASETASKREWHLKMKEAMTRIGRESTSGKGKKKIDQPDGESLHPEAKVLHCSVLQISIDRSPKRPNANGGDIQRPEFLFAVSFLIISSISAVIDCSLRSEGERSSEINFDPRNLNCAAPVR
jgi:hypothetical protein